MRRFRLFLLAVCLIASSGCSSPLAPASTPSAIPPNLSPSLTPSPPVAPTPTVTPTATPLGCLTQAGRVQAGSLDETKPPQDFLIYLPPCYDQQADRDYPVLYLLHGQTYTDEQWVNMGAPQTADKLIQSGQASPFIMVFPDDRYWNLPPGPAFGDRLIRLLVPSIDANYRTVPDASQRALGGLSRGGGWAIHMLLTQYNTFGIVGLHSPVIFADDSAVLEKLFSAVLSGSWPRVWLDGGDRDGELGNIRRFEGLLSRYEVPHEWRLYTGDHTERYWSTHLKEYLQWYSQQFQAAGAATATPSASPTKSP